MGYLAVDPFSTQSVFSFGSDDAETDTRKGMYNLEDIVTFSVGGKGAGKRQGCAVFAPTLIPFAGRTI